MLLCIMYATMMPLDLVNHMKSNMQQLESHIHTCIHCHSTVHYSNNYDNDNEHNKLKACTVIRIWKKSALQTPLFSKICTSPYEL